MGYNQNNNDDGEEEAAEAQNRIDQILGGGAPQQQQYPQQQPQQDAGYSDDPLGGGPRVELHSRAARSALGYDQPQGGGRQQSQRQRGPAPRAQQAILVVGGILVLGIVVVIVLVVLAGALKPGAAPIALPFVSTATPTPTDTPTPTATPTPAPTIPPLTLPNLTCLVQSQTGCLDYCQNVANLQECDAARSTVETIDHADFTAVRKCLEPATGANTGNPQTCLENAYRVKQGLPTPAN